MTTEILEFQLKQQAQRQLAERIGQENDRFGTVPANEVVQSQPIESFQLSSDLRTILTADQQRELEQILQSVWLFNDVFVDERTVVAETYLELSDESRELSERCNQWFSKFVAARLSKQNPKDNNSPFRRFERLVNEFQNLFRDYFNRPLSIGYVFYDRPVARAMFDIFQGVFSEYFTSIYGRACFKRAAIDREPQLIPVLHDCYTQCSAQGGWHFDRFFPFLEFLAEAVADNSTVEPQRDKSDTAIRKELAKIAEDIKVMRPFLAGSDAAEFIAEFGGRFVGMRWKLRYGIAQLCIGQSRDDLLRELNTPVLTADSLPTANVGHDGILADVSCPWVTTDSWPNPIGLLLNLTVLESVRDLLLDSYDRIDFDVIRRKGWSGEFTSDEEVQILALSALDLESEEADTNSAAVEPSVSFDEENVALTPEPLVNGSRVTRRLRPLRQQKLVKILTERFECEVSEAKGSEMKVYRPGGRVCIMKHHKRNPEISVYKLKDMLLTLGIAIRDWLKVVTRKNTLA